MTTSRAALVGLLALAGLALVPTAALAADHPPAPRTRPQVTGQAVPATIVGTASAEKYVGERAGIAVEVDHDGTWASATTSTGVDRLRMA